MLHLKHYENQRSETRLYKILIAALVLLLVLSGIAIAALLARLPKQPSGTENGPSPEPIEATSSALAQNELAGQMESYYQSEVVKQGNSFEAFPAAMPLPEKEEPG